MFLYCKWQGKRVDCDKVVMQRKTDDGFCCSINTIDLAESYAASEDDAEEEMIWAVGKDDTKVSSLTINLPR